VFLRVWRGSAHQRVERREGVAPHARPAGAAAHHGEPLWSVGPAPYDMEQYILYRHCV
jgi:hypothetical protein